jgi:hypothetical protein
MKKSYNPFKMWGSWVGALSGILVQFWSKFGLVIDKFCSPNIIACMPVIRDNSLIFYIVLPIIGFLIGWGIHSLIRRMRK